jgi:hypothetical protein
MFLRFGKLETFHDPRQSNNYRERLKVQGEKTMNKSEVQGFSILKKIYKDLRRGNDPTIGWEEPEQYLEVLAWIRTGLGLGGIIGTVFCLTWIYIQLQQAPAQKFLRDCQQRGETPSYCNERWSESHSNS